MPVFRIISETNYVEADNRRTALSFARGQVKAEACSSRDIVALARDGKAIIDASTGDVIDAQAETQEGSQA